MTYRQRIKSLDDHNRQMEVFVAKEVKEQERRNSLSEPECYEEGFKLGRDEYLDGAKPVYECIFAMNFPYPKAFRKGYYSAF